MKNNLVLNMLLAFLAAASSSAFVIAVHGHNNRLESEQQCREDLAVAKMKHQWTRDSLVRTTRDLKELRAAKETAAKHGCNTPACVEGMLMLERSKR